MIVEKLILKNFKSYLDATIDFQPGTNIIVGKNGAGKSSILEAVSFALFKKHSGVLNDLIKLDKNRELEKRKKMSVTLEFRSNGILYKVKRERTKTSSKAILFMEDKNSSKEYINFVRLVSGDFEVNKEIQDILSMDSELFLNAIYIKQGEIANLVLKTPAERKKLISKLLGIESLEKAWKNSLQIIHEYENKKIEVKTIVDSSKQIITKLKDEKITYTGLNSKKKELNHELIELQEFNQKKIFEKERMDSEKSVFETLNLELKNESDSLQKLRTDKEVFDKQLTEINNAEEDMDKLKPKVDKVPIYEDFLTSYKEIKNLKEKQSLLEKQLNDVNVYNEVLKKEEPLYKEYKTLENDLKRFNERKNKINNKLQLMAKDLETKKDLEKEILKDKRDIDDFSENVNNKLSIEVKDFESLNKLLEGNKTKIQEKINTLQETISSKNQEISSLKEKVRAANEDKKQLEKVEDECPLCKSEISPEKRNQLNSTYRDIIANGTKNIENINKDIKKSSSQKDFLLDKLKEIEDVIKESQNYKNKKENLNKNLNKKNNLEKGINAEKKDKLELGKILTMIKDKEERLENINKSKESYLEAKGSVKALEKPFVITNDLAKVNNSIDKEVENIKAIMKKDSFLSSDIEEEKLKERIDDLKQLNNRYKQLEGILTTKKVVISQIEVKEKSIDEVTKKINKINSDLEVSKFNEFEYNKNIRTINSNTEKINEYLEKIGKLDGELTQITKSIKELEEKVKDVDKNKQDLENLDDFLKLLKDIRELFSKDGIQRDLRLHSKPLIEKHAKEYFEKFNFSYHDLNLDEDYDITVFGSNGKTKLDMVSGGEKIGIALSLRFGITKAISKGNTNTILLDEPTIYLDDYRRDELIGIIGNVDIPQMIIVTHDNELENAADKVIKVEKNDLGSKIISD
ncbi:MAG: SMC family ATPase [Methanobrevibacter sp.]|jgi:exonuclease SbcC|nr:SMC family ATPase [Candidatus Methanovirga aequatorialis]